MSDREQQGGSQGWKRTTLGEALPIHYGKARNDRYGTARVNTPVYGSSGRIDTFNRAITSGPSLIIGRKGNVGAAYYSPEPCWPIDTVYFTEASEEGDLRFFKYLLDHLQLVRMDRSTAVPGLSRDDYNATEVFVPELDRQRFVVAEIEKQFSRLDEAVVNLKRAKANIKRYKSSVLNAAVEGSLDFVGRAIHGQKGAISKWRVVRLADIGELFSGQSPASNTVNTEGKGVLYVTGPEQWDGQNLRMSKWTTSPKRIVPDGCFFITVKGAGVGKVFPGKACAIGRDIYAFKPVATVSSQFVMYALIASVQSVLRHASGDIPGLSRSHILDHEILLPSREEQDRLVEELEMRLSHANELESKSQSSLKRAEHLRQSILAKMFMAGSVQIDTIQERANRNDAMEKKKLPALPPSRKSEAEDRRVDLEEVLSNHPGGISAEALFQEAGYRGDQVDTFYRDLSRLATRIEQIFPKRVEASWPMAGPVKVRLKS